MARTMADRLHLRPRHRRLLEGLLREHLPDVEVWAYGSRVNGRSHDGSDLDLVLRGPELEEVPLDRLMDFEEAVRESTIPFLVEARDWARLPERFHREIEREYVVLVAGGGRDEWVAMNLGSVCTKIGSGATPRGGKDVYLPSGPYALIRSQNILNDGFRHAGLAYISERHAFDLDGVEVLDGDVLLNITGDSVARACQVDSRILPARVNQHVAIVRPDPTKLDSDFLRYFLVRPETQANLLSWAGSGGTRNALTKAMIEAFDVQAPEDVSEQRAIAHILGTLDDKIAVNRRMNETLEAMARALFKSWFVDFDPVRAKMEGRGTGLPQDMADLFPDRLVDSEMGEIPEGWGVAALPERIEVNPRRSLLKGRVAPYLPMANMPTHGHMPESVAVRPFGSGMRFANGDTLVARITPCLENGKTAYVDFLTDDEIGWGSTEYIVLRPRSPLPNQFAYCLARSARFREFAIQNMSGTSGRQRVPATALRGFLMVVPPGRLAARFGEVVGPLFDRARHAGYESRTLAALRNTLLPNLISGEIRVPEAVRGMESVA